MAPISRRAAPQLNQASIAKHEWLRESLRGSNVRRNFTFATCSQQKLWSEWWECCQGNRFLPWVSCKQKIKCKMCCASSSERQWGQIHATQTRQRPKIDRWNKTLMTNEVCVHSSRSLSLVVISSPPRERISHPILTFKVFGSNVLFSCAES